MKFLQIQYSFMLLSYTYMCVYIYEFAAGYSEITIEKTRQKV